MASTPGTVNYPTALDDSTSLIATANRAATTLASTFTAGDVTAHLTDASLFPASGTFTVENEIVYYTGKATNDLTGCVKGREGTTDATHAGGVAVEGRITARHHTVLADALLAVETELGVAARAASIFNRRSATTGAIKLPAASDFGVLEELTIGATSTVEIPADSSLLIYDVGRQAIPASAIDISQPPYNCVADGVTVNTAGLQAAADDARRLRKALWIPPTALPFVTGTIIVPGDIMVLGGGWQSQLKLANGTNDYVFSFVPPGVAITAAFSNFTIDGNASNQSAGGCIFAAGSVQSRFDALHLTNAFDVCLWLYQIGTNNIGHHNRVTRCLFDNLSSISGANQQGIRMQSSDENTVAFCDFENWGGLSSARGSEPYAIKDWSGIQKIVSNVFVGGGEGIRIQDSSSTRIIGNTFDGVGRAAIHASGSKNVILGNLFSDGSSESNGAYGQCEIDNSSSAVIVSNAFTVQSTGVVRNCVRELSSSSHKTLVSNNVFDLSGTLFASNAAVELLSSLGDSKATGNLGWPDDATASMIFQQRSDIGNNVVLPLSTDFGLCERLVIGATRTFEIPATSSLTIYNVS